MTHTDISPDRSKKTILCEPERKIEMVHLQLTGRCNLNCWFCGQRKKDWSAMRKEELQPHEWLNVVEWLENYSAKQNEKPVVMIWGGEAILSSVFEAVVNRLHKSGFRLGMITNGSLLHRNPELISEAFDKIYISVDGSEKEHDEIRGKGIYRKIQENLQMLKPHAPKRILMMVLTNRTVLNLRNILQGFKVFEPDQVILQDMILLEQKEIDQYKNWMQSEFGQTAEEIDAWLGDSKDKEIRDAVSTKCQELIKDLELPFEVQYLPHISETESRSCMSPFRHIHIMWNGEMSFCTDFTDFSCGNVRLGEPDVLFQNCRAEKFRKSVLKGECVTCKHCSWRYRDDFTEL